MKNSNLLYETERARYQQRFESVSSQRDTVSNNQGFEVGQVIRAYDFNKIDSH